MKQNQDNSNWKERLDQFVIEEDVQENTQEQWSTLKEKLPNNGQQRKYLTHFLVAASLLTIFISYFFLHSQEGSSSTLKPKAEVLPIAASNKDDSAVEEKKMELSIHQQVSKIKITTQKITKALNTKAADRSTTLVKLSEAQIDQLNYKQQADVTSVAIADTSTTSVALVNEKPVKPKMKVVHINNLNARVKELKNASLAANVGNALKKLLQTNTAN